jgi:hypothetical protein
MSFRSRSSLADGAAFVALIAIGLGIFGITRGLISQSLAIVAWFAAGVFCVYAYAQSRQPIALVAAIWCLIATLLPIVAILSGRTH